MRRFFSISVMICAAEIASAKTTLPAVPRAPILPTAPVCRKYDLLVSRDARIAAVSACIQSLQHYERTILRAFPTTLQQYLTRALVVNKSLAGTDLTESQKKTFRTSLATEFEHADEQQRLRKQVQIQVQEELSYLQSIHSSMLRGA